MKRKLIFGFGVAAAVTVLCGLFIARTLTNLASTVEVQDMQERIIKQHDRMLYRINNIQARLYAIEAGRRVNLDLLVADLRAINRQLAVIHDIYASYESSNTCSYCHLRPVKGNVKTAAENPHLRGQMMLREVSDRIDEYEENISRIVGNGHPARGIDHSLVSESAAESEKIETIIHDMRTIMDKMGVRIKTFELAEMRRSVFLIAIVIGAGILLTGVVVVMTIRSITTPLNMLVKGMERLSAGDYGAKLDLRRADEIGFLADNFDIMTEKLNGAMMQKEALLKELKDLNSSLEQRVEEATEGLKIAHEKVLRQETLSAVGTFAAGVAHELATPIASIMTYFQMVKEKVPEQDMLAADVQIIERELRRCNNILRGMLDFAKAPEKETKFIDINEIIRELLTLVKYQPSYKRSITIKEDLAAGMPAVPAIPGQLRQVFMNFILNALQSMPGKGALSVSTSLSQDGMMVVVSITDTGSGMSGEELAGLFQPFRTGRESGTGLGLFLSFEIIRRHGGNVDVKSEVGKGTTFTLYFPVSPDADFVGRPTAQQEAGSGADGGQSSPETPAGRGLDRKGVVG